MSCDIALTIDQLSPTQIQPSCSDVVEQLKQSSRIEPGSEVAIGRIRLGTVVYDQNKSDDGRSITILQARMRTVTKERERDGTIFIGRGNDFFSAVRDLLREHTSHSFRIVSSTTEHHRQMCSARLFVTNEKDPSVLHFGLASSGDEATALVAATIRALSNGGLLKGRYLCAGHRQAISRAEKLVELTHARTDSKHRERRAELFHSILVEINEFAAGVSMIAAKNYKSHSVLCRFDVTSPKSESTDISPTIVATPWYEWNPGLENDDLTLRETVESMPASPPSDIPAIVRFFENPASPCKMRGAISLVDHDHLHIILGRGLQDQDEAFVLGFTMGTEKNLTRIERWVFKFILSKLYPQPYRISSQLLCSYDLGVRAGKEMGVRKINRIDTRKYLDMRLCDVRRELGIDSKRLRELYAEESNLIPGTMVSERLPK